MGVSLLGGGDEWVWSMDWEVSSIGLSSTVKHINTHTCNYVTRTLSSNGIRYRRRVYNYLTMMHSILQSVFHTGGAGEHGIALVEVDHKAILYSSVGINVTETLIFVISFSPVNSCTCTHNMH